MLNQKETELIKDLKDQEQLCIEKYKKNSDAASDRQLKNLFNQIGQIEQQHLQTITQIEKSGSAPSGNGGGGGNNPVMSLSFTQTYGGADSPDKQTDSFLCTDLLATEKHASHLYDTCIFEFKDVGIRDALNQIQKEEQQHGEKIYCYMSTNGMYS